MVASRSVAVVCRCVPANCNIRQAKTFLFIVSPGIKLQEESVYSKAVVVCLYCERSAGKTVSLMWTAAEIVSTHQQKKDELSRLV